MKKNQMKKNQMKNHPVVVGPKVLLVGRADRLGRLVDLPVDQADHLEGAEDGEPRKAWIEPGKAWIEPRKAWIEPRKAQRQRKSEHSEQKRERGKGKREWVTKRSRRIPSPLSLYSGPVEKKRCRKPVSENP